MEPVNLLSRVLAHTGTIIEKANPERLAAATPCALWSAGDVLNHLVAGLRDSATIADGQPIGRSPYDAPEGVIGDDPQRAYAEAAKVALDAFAAPGALERVGATPAGELPGSVWIGFPTFDTYVHGWDLARAWGVEAEFPDELTAPVLSFLRPRFDPPRSTEVVGAPFAVPADAPLLDQLVAYLGRDPHWRAPVT
jgi:uncharacterized protein (TIGR03086 family)